MNAEQDSWQKNLDRLAALLNIARISLLISVITFWVLTKNVATDKNFILPILGKAELYSWAIIYNGFIVISLILPRWQNQTEALPNVWSVTDITMIAWLMQMSDGVMGGFGILLLPFVCSSCLLSRGRYPMLYAGYASLLVIIITCWQFDADDLISDSMHLWSMVFILCSAIFLLASITAYVATYLTRTQQKQDQQLLVLDSYKHLLDRAFNDVQEGVVVLDTGNVVWLMNSKAENYFPDIKTDTATEVFIPVIQYWKQCQKNTFELDCQLDNWSMRVRTRILQESNTALLMLFIRAKHELEQEAMAVKLTALGLLTANLAHEIRNPLSAIRQASELLQEDECNEFRRRLFTIVDNNISRIDKMVEEVGILSKKGTSRKKLIDLNQFWQAFYQEFILTTAAAENCIQVQIYHNHLTVWCDPNHLQQIMWNLMNNAWRHSAQNEQAIQIIFRYHSEHEMAIYVLDNGTGVSLEHQQHLFEPFFTTAVNGTGLGLYVARELAQSNQGQLSYKMQMNGFELILPRSKNG